jgi:hypothetical protein
MKLALLIALSADKRSGHPLTPEMEPFDQALAKFKGMVEKGVGAAPTVELWSGGRVVKSARFKVLEQSAESTVEETAEEVPVERPELVADELPVVEEEPTKPKKPSANK